MTKYKKGEAKVYKPKGRSLTPVPSSSNEARTSARAKKIKVVYDPSENYVPRKRNKKGDSSFEEKKSDSSPSKADSGDKIVDISLGMGTTPEADRMHRPMSFERKSLTPKSDKPSKIDNLCLCCDKGEIHRKGYSFKSCKHCLRNAHLKCLEMDVTYARLPIHDGFVCIDCIECIICSDTSKVGELHFCSICQNPFHAKCHNPKIPVKMSRNNAWVCQSCAGDSSAAESVGSSSSTNPKILKPTPVSKVVGAEDEGKSEFAGFSDTEINESTYGVKPSASILPIAIKEEEISDDDDGTFNKKLDNLENVKDWSVADVYEYFNHYFPDYAHVFQEQEIDGTSLVLMKKSDILSGFGLKIGPAILLYQRILMLQTNDKDIRITWL